MEKIKQFANVVARHYLIGVDSSIFIYAFERHPVFELFSRLMFEYLEEGKIQLITSTITVSEILVKPFSRADIEVIALYENVLLRLPNFTLVPIDYRLARIAAQIRATYSIFLPDAIQLAAAISAGATLFITNDHQLKKVRDITVLCLSDYI